MKLPLWQRRILIVYVQYIENTELKQNVLMSDNLTTTTREDRTSVVDVYFTKHNLPYNNLVSCCTDGAASMMGEKIRASTAV